jgi:hypothetical protein
MNIIRDPDTVIDAWLADGPQRLPDGTRHAIAVGIRAIKRGPVGLPWRLSMPRFVPAVATAAIILVVGVVALGVYLNRPNVAVNPSPTPSASPSTPASGGMWPQTTMEEIRQAQLRADAGDPDYTWQVDPLLEQHNDEGGRSWMRLVEGQPEIADRFLREVLGWDEYMVNVYAGRADGNEAADGVYSDIGYLRCAPGEANRLEQGDTCKPTLDDLHYETVSIDLAQLDQRGPDGIWIVNGWRMSAPYAPVTEVSALVENFLQARIDGHGAEALVYSSAEATDLPLLYATTTGSRYERYEIELVRGPRWAAGYMDFDVRLFADGGQTVVEQEMGWVYWSPEVPTLWAARTTENGQPVTVRYGFLDGKATAFAEYPWERSCGQDCLAWWSGSGAGYISMTAGPVAVTDGCLVDATDPVSVNIGGIEAVAMDGTGGTECGLFGDWVGAGRPVRIYLVDLPEGSPMPNLAIAIGAEEAPFDDVIEAATPIIESIEFHMP